MPFWAAGQGETTGQEQALVVGVKAKLQIVVIELGLHRQGGRLEHLSLEADQHRSGQKGLTGFGEFLLIAATVDGGQARGLNAAAELVEKAINHGDHVHIPGVKISLLCCVLQQSDGQPSARFSHRGVAARAG